MFILENPLERRPEPMEVEARWAAYFTYLRSVKEQLGKGALQYALSDWHRDYGHRMSPHDAWVENISLEEKTTGLSPEVRAISGSILLLGSYHDGHIRFDYESVRSYKLVMNGPNDSPILQAHGDWLADEVRLSEDSLVIHEILFANGARWTIEAKDLHYHWRPL